VQRLWREEGLKVPYHKRKKPLRGIGAAVGAMCPIAPNALWAMDFQFDTTVDGRTIKLLNIVNEYTRECPVIVVERSIDADRVVATLDRLAIQRGAPAFVRFDNGPELIVHAVADWCQFNGVATVFIDSGAPWQNAWIESFNGRLRDELLNGWHFDSLLEAMSRNSHPGLARDLQPREPACSICFHTCLRILALACATLVRVRSSARFRARRTVEPDGAAPSTGASCSRTSISAIAVAPIAMAIAVDASTTPLLNCGNVPFCVSAASSATVRPHWSASLRSKIPPACPTSPFPPAVTDRP
jgi:Integrase core domain